MTSTPFDDTRPQLPRAPTRLSGILCRHTPAVNRLPVPLVGLDSDNGSEFISRSLLDYCRRYAITF